MREDGIRACGLEVGGDFWTLRWFNFERVAHDGVRYVCSALGR